MDKKTFTRISKTLADPRRYEILRKIAACEKLSCVALKKRIPVTAATLSHHLKELNDAQLVEIERKGKFAHLQLRRAVWDAYRKELSKI